MKILGLLRCWLWGHVYDHPIAGLVRIDWYFGPYRLRCVNCGQRLAARDGERKP